MNVESQVVAPRKIESVLMSCAWGNEDRDIAYVSMSLRNGRLSILISQPIDTQPIDTNELAQLAESVLSTVCARPDDLRIEGDMPVGHFNEMIEGCQRLFPRYGVTPYSRNGYVSAAVRTGNLRILESFRGQIEAERNEVYRELFVGVDGKIGIVTPLHEPSPYLTRNEAIEKFDAALLEDADRFFHAKKRVDGAPVIPPTKCVNGALVETPVPSIRPAHGIRPVDMKLRIYREWVWERCMFSPVLGGGPLPMEMRFYDQLQCQLPDGRWEAVPLVEGEKPQLPEGAVAGGYPEVLTNHR